MSDMLERPTIPMEDVGPLDGLEEHSDPDLDAILASLAEEKISFNDLRYARPCNPHDEPITLASKKVLTNGTEARTPLSNFRDHLNRTLQTHGYSETAAEDATTMMSELVGNVRLHGARPDEKYSGECRIRAIKHPSEDDLGRSVTRVTTIIEAVNFSANPESSKQEQVRGEFEGGNGLDLVMRLAESHDGEVGRYRIIRDANGHETFVPQEANCGNFVVWAALRAEVIVDPQVSEISPEEGI